MSKGKVLFLYPNCEGYGGVPNGVALLSSCLKVAGFETRCFDTTFLKSPPLSHFQRAKHGYFLETDPSRVWGNWTESSPKEIPALLLNTIEEFKPDLIAISHIDVEVLYARELLKIIKEQFDIPIIAGGITSTSSPELIINNKYIDMVCIGEGEKALIELINCIVNKKDYGNIKNLWVKKGGRIKKNPLRPLINMNTLPFQDWSIFDQRHYYKSYCGKFHRTAFIEMARGCPFSCTYCVNSALRRKYRGLGGFLRFRSIDKTFDEICYLKNLYKLELLFFIEDNFLGMPESRFNYFCKEYKKRIKLPFYIQTRSETIKESYVKRLKEINISTIAIGVEHAHEGFRRKYMNRNMSNESIGRAFEIIHKHKIRTTANMIIGMPYETEDMMAENIKLLRSINPDSVSINYFAPFRGTAMREMAVRKGIIPVDHVIKKSNICLDMPQFRADRIKHYYENLKKYVDGELEFLL